MPQIQQVFEGNMSVYGADKVWRALKRRDVGQDVEVARCTVERLMRRLGLLRLRCTAMRGKGVRTTVPDAKAACPQDRVNRVFKADRPNQLWVGDFTYVSCSYLRAWQGFVYVAISVEDLARRVPRCIGSWLVSASMQTDFVLDALEPTLWARQRGRDGE